MSNNREMNMVKNILRGMAFVLVFAVLLVACGVAFEPKSSEPGDGIANANARGFYGEPKNTIDVLILGDSNAYSSCSPMYIWNKYGIPSYVAAEGYQSVTGATNMLEEFLTCQSPKLVVIDVNMLWTGKTYMKKLETNLKNMAYRYLPLAQYHNRWKSMNVSDMFRKKDYNYRCVSRGQFLSMDVKPYTGDDNMVKTDDVEDIPEISRLLLENMVKKCKDIGIEVMFMETPTARSWNYARHNAMVKYAADTGIDFVDMNTLAGRYAVDWSTDTRDAGRHLNCVGAEKISEYLGKYISDRYELEDKRDMDKYSEWNRDYMKYKKFLDGGDTALMAEK